MEPLLDPGHRLLEENLLRAGRDVGMSAEMKASSLAAVGAAGAGLAVVGISQAGKISWLAGKGWPLAFCALGIASVAAVGILGSKNTPQFKATVPVTEVSKLAQPEGADQDAFKLEAKVAISEEDRVLPSKLTNKEPASIKKKVRPAKSLSDELELLKRANGALSGGNASLALTRLAEYRREFPHPRLGPEAEVLSIEALAKSGQLSSAQNRAKRFVVRHPDSPLLARVKKYVP